MAGHKPLWHPKEREVGGIDVQDGPMDYGGGVDVSIPHEEYPAHINEMREMQGDQRWMPSDRIPGGYNPMWDEEGPINEDRGRPAFDENKPPVRYRDRLEERVGQALGGYRERIAQALNGREPDTMMPMSGPPRHRGYGLYRDSRDMGGDAPADMPDNWYGPTGRPTPLLRDDDVRDKMGARNELYGWTPPARPQVTGKGFTNDSDLAAQRRSAGPRRPPGLSKRDFDGGD